MSAPRARLPRVLLTLALLVLAAVGAAQLWGWDSVAGFTTGGLTGAAVAVGLGLLVTHLLQRRRTRRARDEAALDALEPLGPARAEERR